MLPSYAATQITIVDFINRAERNTTYRLRGVVSNIVNKTYGNFTLEDETGSIFVYGLLTSTGQSKQFASMGIVEGDTLTMQGSYKLYEGTHEVVDGQYISHVSPAEEDVEKPEVDYTKTVVDFETDFANGWSGWVGKTLTFTNDFYIHDTYNKRMAYHRLRSPEEYGDEGTKGYMNAKAANAIAECTLSGVTLKSGCRPGTIIRGLKAQVTAANKLQAVNTPTIIYNELPTQLPDLGNANVVIAGTNIENFFVTLDGYASASNETTLSYQKQKISKGLYHLNADIYAICEMEQGPLAATEMVRLLNELAGTNVYDWVNAGFSTYDAIMVCYIYRKDKVAPYGSYIMPYTSGVYRYREAIQCFEHIATGELFNVSVNHFKAKTGTDNTDGERQTNMQRLISKLSSAEAIDPDVLVMGDLNAYTMEASNLLLTEGEGYVDLLMKYDPNGYSYVYDKLVGYLDHAYCSPSMESQVTKAVSYHMNADTPTSYEYSKGNTTMYRYADHEPILVGLHLGEDVSTNIEEVETGVTCTKVLRNGQIVILRGDNAYTITGQLIY